MRSWPSLQSPGLVMSVTCNALANPFLEVLERVLNQETEQELFVKKEIAAKINAGEIVSDAFMKQHAVSVSRVVGHTSTSIGNFDAKMLTCQDGRETWQVKITKRKDRI